MISRDQVQLRRAYGGFRIMDRLTTGRGFRPVRDRQRPPFLGRCFSNVRRDSVAAIRITSASAARSRLLHSLIFRSSAQTAFWPPCFSHSLQCDAMRNELRLSAVRDLIGGNTSLQAIHYSSSLVVFLQGHVEHTMESSDSDARVLKGLSACGS